MRNEFIFRSLAFVSVIWHKLIVTGSQTPLTFRYSCLSSRSLENIDIRRLIYSKIDMIMFGAPLSLKSFRSDSIRSIQSFFY